MSGFDPNAFDQGAFDPNAFEFDDAVTASLTGTALSNLTEQALVDGGRTIIITLANDTWVAAGSTFDAQRQNIIDGLVSAQSEANGWNAERSNISVTAVVRDSDTQVTITLPALANYDITANEVITATVPASALTGGSELVAGQTVTITADAVVSAGGHFIPGLAGIRAGRRKDRPMEPSEALAEAAEIIEETVSEVLEDETRPEPIQRVSRQRKSEIIDRAAAEFARQNVLIGELTALERAATRIAKIAIKRRREALRRSEAKQEEAATLEPPRIEVPDEVYIRVIDAILRRL